MKDVHPFRRRREMTSNKPALVRFASSPANLVLGCIMALTSIAMVVTSSLQWMATKVQLGQNDAIILQMQAEQDVLKEQVLIMKQQSAQTDAVIDQMRLEQRPWLGVTQPQISNPLQAGKPVSFVIPVKNSGRTPGTIVSANVRVFTRKTDENVALVVDDLEPKAKLKNQLTSIAPDATHRFQGASPDALGEPVFDALFGPSKSRILYLAGVLQYTDVQGRIRQTNFCFSFDPETQLLVAHPKHNSMN
jgi:hypothetical protein